MIQPKHIVLVITTLLLALPLSAQRKHEFYLMGNNNMHIENSMYVRLMDPGYEAWSGVHNKYSYGGGYTFILSNYFGFGVNVEKEKVSFEDFANVSDATAERIAYGAHFQCMYPNRSFHFTGGGFLNLSKLKSDDLRINFPGFEYGLFMGPEYSIKNFGLAFFFHPKFSYYYSKDASDEAVLILTPRLSLKLSYTLSGKSKE